MFARKKTADVQTSLQRFCDLHRDAASRAKHFKLAIEMLAPQVYFVVEIFWVRFGSY